jgi:predicted ArsR family transcriptional regulator
VDTGEDRNRDAVAGLSSLDDPARRRLYDYVAACDEPVSREEAAAATGIGRSLAAYHLDKLAAAGLLDAGYARPPGREGPGAGRPAKRYTRTQQGLTASVPPRSYGLLAGLLTDALAEALADDGSGAVHAAVGRAARRAGRTAGAGTDAMGALRACGYEPALDEHGSIELRNCPFHHLADEHSELVCGLNHQLVTGLLEATGDPPRRAELAPRPGRCCVAIHAPGRHRPDLPARRGGRRAPSENPRNGAGDG